VPLIDIKSFVQNIYIYIYFLGVE